MEFLRGLATKVRPKPAESAGGASHMEVLEELHAKVEGEALRERLTRASAVLTESPVKASWGEIRRYTTLSQRLNLTYKLVETLFNWLGDEKNLKDKRPEDFTVRHGWLLGAEVLLYNLLQQFRNIARDKESQDVRENFVNLLRFASCWDLTLRLGEKTLLDFLDVNSKKVSPIPYLEYLVRAVSIGKTITEQEVFDTNPNELSRQYPAMARVLIRCLSTQVKAIIGLAGRDFSAASLPPTMREAAPFAQRICDNITELRFRAYTLFLSPDAGNFPELQNFLERNLKTSNLTVRKFVWFLLDLDRPDRLNLAYRTARGFAQEGKSTEFYRFACKMIDQYADLIGDQFAIPSREEIQAICNINGNSPNTPELTSLRKAISEIFSKTSRRIWEIDPKTVEWECLALPQKVKVVFDQNRPRKFTIFLAYQAPKREPTEIYLTVDATKEELDWAWKEDPNYPEDAEIEQFRNSLLFAAGEVLKSVQKEAAAQYEKKTEFIKNSRPENSFGKPIKERNEDPVYKLRKTIKGESREVVGEGNVLFQVLDTPEKERVRIKILMPESEPELQKLFRYVSFEDREKLADYLKKPNELGIDRELKKLRLPGQNGETLYSLRIGEARVLLTETGSKSGERVFTIYSPPRYRKDVYLKTGI